MPDKITEPEVKWECSACGYELVDDLDSKPIGLTFPITNSQGQMIGIPIEVCPHCRSLLLSEITMRDLQIQLTSRIITTNPGI